MTTQKDDVTISSQADALCLHEACLSYGSTSTEYEMVLDHLNLTVPLGAIYGLLGASGCGKTSLLTCIVGLRKLQSGQIVVLGVEPGTPGSGVPGPRIGYMPQENALMPDLTITTIMFYYGRIFGMTSDVITQRIQYLRSLLNLPPPNVLIKHFSGGQQRRVSLAIALLHDPELLILDEPTVGLDLLLRQRIWDYLKVITEENKKSVIMTTHYIEEARQADVVGMMRQGKILSESCPSQILQHFQCDTLERVFLTLSREQSKQNHARPKICPNEDLISKQNQNCNDKKTQTLFHDASFCGKLHSLLTKNFLRCFNDRMFLVFLICFPIFEISLFFLAIGHEPQQALLAVVNDELPRNVEMYEPLSDCSTKKLSCKFLSTINSEIVKMQVYVDKASALAALKSRDVRGVMCFGRNFSAALTERLKNNLATSEVTLAEGEVEVWLDMSDLQFGFLLKKTLYDSFFKFFESLDNLCGLKTCAKLTKPMTFEEPIYGTRNPSYTSSMFPGIILFLIYFFGVGITCTTIAEDILDGIWNRDLVSGVTPIQIMLSHLLTQFLMLTIQIAECLAISFLVFEVTNKGSLWLVFGIAMLEGLCGISCGIFVSLLCNTRTMAGVIGLGSFIPVFEVCGIVWPTEGMPYLVRLFAELVPITSGIVALRSITCKGWTISHPVVYISIARAVVWICSCLIASVIVIRVKKIALL